MNRDVIIIDEFVAMTTGHKFALEHIGIENMLAKNVEIESYGTIDNEVLNKVNIYIESYCL